MTSRQAVRIRETVVSELQENVFDIGLDLRIIKRTIQTSWIRAISCPIVSANNEVATAGPIAMGRAMDIATSPGGKRSVATVRALTILDLTIDPG